MNGRWPVAAVLGFAVGLAGETLLFLQRQCRAIEQNLGDDFRVVLYLKSDAEPGRQKVLEEKLRALSDVDDVRAVSRQEQLAELRREDPELVESVLLVGENPLAAAYEVRLAAEAIPRVSQWLLQAKALGEFSDVRYKPAQVQALLQAQFYARFIDLAVASLVCLAAALAIVGLWTLRQGRPPAAGLALAVLGAAGGGALAGAAAVCLMVLPMRLISPWWGWPSVSAQAALLFGAAAVGWVSCARPD